MSNFRTLMIGAKLFTMVCFSISIAGEYAPTQMILIGWGDSPNQLKIDLPFHEDVYNTPADSSDDWVEYNGPNIGFVDAHENTYIASNRYVQLKGFDKNGGLIFDYSEGGPGYDAEFFSGGIESIYVDSLCRIYVVDGMAYDYAAVIDTMGHLLQKLTPFGPGSGITVASMHPNSRDVLAFYLMGRGYYTYSNGSFEARGSMGWRANDGYYYTGFQRDSTAIVLRRLQNADTSGMDVVLSENTIEISGALVWYTEFLGVDDEMQLFLYMDEYNPDANKVLIIDSNLNPAGALDLPIQVNKYKWSMRPFMRPSDGNIYEFRCLDDGLHVIRWTKE